MAHLSTIYSPLSIHPPSVIIHPFIHPPPTNNYLHLPATHHLSTHHQPSILYPSTIRYLAIHASIYHPTRVDHALLIFHPLSLIYCPFVYSLTISHPSNPHPSTNQHKYAPPLTMHPLSPAHHSSIRETPGTIYLPPSTVHPAQEAGGPASESGHPAPLGGQTGCSSSCIWGRGAVGAEVVYPPPPTHPLFWASRSDKRPRSSGPVGLSVWEGGGRGRRLQGA